MNEFSAKVGKVISCPTDALRSAVIELSLMRARQMRAEDGQGQSRSPSLRGTDNV